MLFNLRAWIRLSMARAALASPIIPVNRIHERLPWRRKARRLIVVTLLIEHRSVSTGYR